MKNGLLPIKKHESSSCLVKLNQIKLFIKFQFKSLELNYPI